MGSAAHSFLAASAEAEDMVESLEGGERRAGGGIDGVFARSTVAPKVTGPVFSFAAIVTWARSVSGGQ